MTEQEFRQRVLPLQRLMYGVALGIGGGIVTEFLTTAEN